MEWSWLVTLICPLMMIFMMFGMRGGHSHGSQKKQVDIIQVKNELSELKEQNELMRKQMSTLSSSNHASAYAKEKINNVDH